MKEVPKEKDVNERIANYTKWLMISTIILSAATISLAVSTGSLWQYAAEQAHDMKKSIEASEKSADAAKDQAEIAKKAFGSSARAWVGVDTVKIFPVSNETHDNKIIVSYGNIGKEPAIKFSLNVEYLEENIPGMMGKLLGKKLNHSLENCSNKQISSNSQSIFPTNQLGQYKYLTDIYKININESKYRFVFGCMKYESLGIPHYTHFCLQTNNFEDFVRCEYGNETD